MDYIEREGRRGTWKWHVKNVTRLYLRVHRLYRSIASIRCNKLTKRRLPTSPRITVGLDFVTFVTLAIIYEINSLQLSMVKHGYRVLIIYTRRPIKDVQFPTNWNFTFTLLSLSYKRSFSRIHLVIFSLQIVKVPPWITKAETRPSRFSKQWMFLQHFVILETMICFREQKWITSMEISHNFFKLYIYIYIFF